jgi:hypothetical protein
MMEERLMLIFGYILIASLLLVFCLFSSFTKTTKMLGILVVTVFYYLTWQGYIELLGWPSEQGLPDNFRISWVVIEEPNKLTKEQGAVYLWIRSLDKIGMAKGRPRSFKMIWNEENHRNAQLALSKLREGEQLNGKKTYGVIEKNAGKKANPYEGETKEGTPSFEFTEVPPPSLPPKALVR